MNYFKNDFSKLNIPIKFNSYGKVDLKDLVFQLKYVSDDDKLDTLNALYYSGRIPEYIYFCSRYQYKLYLDMKKK